MNATVTYETQWCPVCDKHTTVLTYRVPEYTKSGQTAMNHGVKWSDGYDIDGKKKGNTDSGTPGVDASYTGYHYTKSVCQICGTINSVDGSGAYNFNNNVYGLNSCDHNFFIDFDNTAYEPYDEHQHTTTLKKGEYCQFCKGTFAKASIKKETHNLARTVDAQVGNNRFYLQEECEDCGYKTTEYISAKAVISSYYGTADGDSHSISVSDLSDKDVHTKIRYGTAAGACNMTSAPNYTKAGYYPVYYEIDYKYGTENMTENGVSYVWLLDDNKKDGSDNQKPVHEHDYRYIETVKPTCTELGYERWQCNTCGGLEKKNYVQTVGHTYKTQTVREATCRQGGLVLEICTKCGDFNEKTTPTVGHHYHDTVVTATCINSGYIRHDCDVCGESYITNTTPYAPHNFKEIVKKPTCTDGGYTTHICETCHLSYTDNYKDALGHSWDKGHNVTDATCDSEGVIEYNCQNCNEKMIKAETAKGHTPGEAATCTKPQTCITCGAILYLPKGHSYKTKVVEPTCTAMGYTVYSCKDCDDTYEGDYTDMLPHSYNTAVTPPTCTKMGYTTYTCEDCGEEYVSDYTDKIAHNYEKNVTLPTCTSAGYTTYTCINCGETYKADYTDVLPHNYNKQTVEPTCTEHGYAVFTCPDCGKSYIGEYTDIKKYHYTKTVTPPTCTEMGYTTYICGDCGDTYKAD